MIPAQVFSFYIILTFCIFSKNTLKIIFQRKNTLQNVLNSCIPELSVVYLNYN